MRSRLLLGLHVGVAVNAIGGAAYGLAGASGVPVEWLHGTPFANYFLPSLILLVVVGGSQVVAAFGIIRRCRQARVLSLLAGTILLIWIAVQLAIIGFVSWLQPAVVIVGVANVILARKLPLGRHATV